MAIQSGTVAKSAMVSRQPTVDRSHDPRQVALNEHRTGVLDKIECTLETSTRIRCDHRSEEARNDHSD